MWPRSNIFSIEEKYFQWYWNCSNIHRQKPFINYVCIFIYAGVYDPAVECFVTELPALDYNLIKSWLLARGMLSLNHNTDPAMTHLLRWHAAIRGTWDLSQQHLPMTQHQQWDARYSRDWNTFITYPFPSSVLLRGVRREHRTWNNKTFEDWSHFFIIDVVIQLLISTFVFSKGVTDFGHLRVLGNMPSEATKLRVLCFLKLFPLSPKVKSEFSLTQF